MSTNDKVDSAEKRFIPLAVPFLGGKELEYVADSIASNWVSSVGPYVDRFEEMTAAAVGTKYAVATVNGTAALHIALLVAGVKPDDEVIVSDLTFIASANAVKYTGAWPVFIDVEPNFWQMDPDKLDDFCRTQCTFTKDGLYNRSSGRRVKALIPVHILGHPVDIDVITGIAKVYGLTVVADAAEAIGAEYKNRPIGEGSDISCLSFNGNKIITTGGGGMFATDNEEMARRAKHLTTQAKSSPEEYIHDEVGFNYRLTNLQAAVGCAQIEELTRHVETKRHIAATYNELLAPIPGIIPMIEAKWVKSTYWLYTVLVDEARFGMNRRDLQHRLSTAGIQTRPLWQPMHLSPVYSHCQAHHIEVASQLYDSALSLPCSVGLTAADQEYVIERLSEFRGHNPLLAE